MRLAEVFSSFANIAVVEFSDATVEGAIIRPEKEGWTIEKVEDSDGQFAGIVARNRRSQGRRWTFIPSHNIKALQFGEPAQLRGVRKPPAPTPPSLREPPSNDAEVLVRDPVKKTKPVAEEREPDVEAAMEASAEKAALARLDEEIAAIEEAERLGEDD